MPGALARIEFVYMAKSVSALAGWFGGDRMVCPSIAEATRGCSWCGIPFAGGMSAVLYIQARTILVNDKHRLIVNLARCVADDELRGKLIRRLARKAFHPDELADAQDRCIDRQAGECAVASFMPNLDAAEDYFVCCWMGRAAKAGIVGEFNGRPAVRWKSDGGDSMVRYRSAIRALVPFSRALRRCTFETLDAIDEFLPRCEDLPGHCLYVDAPWPEQGRRYLYNAGQTDADERKWHVRLRDQLLRFERTRLVVRFGEHPLISELYPENEWEWQRKDGRDQANNDAPEMLLLRNVTPSQANLFST